MMKKTFQLGLLLLGALALSLTLATAEGKYENAKKEMKCESGKCASDKKDTKKYTDGKCGNTKKEMKCGDAKNNMKKEPKKGKCGQGKCG